VKVSDGQPCDAATHIFCVRLAYRLVEIVGPCLRTEEINEAAREFYRAIREDLQAFERQQSGRAV
jgi:hypothetical protein